MPDKETSTVDLSSATILVKLKNLKGDFHAYASENARHRSLNGFSEKLSDDLYKVFVEGEKSSISALIGYIEMNRAFDKVDAIVVDDLMVSWSSYSGNYSDFSIKE